MKLTKNFILEMIRDALSEDEVGEPIFNLDSGEGSEKRNAEIEDQTKALEIRNSLDEIMNLLEEDPDLSLIKRVEEMTHVHSSKALQSLEDAYKALTNAKAVLAAIIEGRGL